METHRQHNKTTKHRGGHERLWYWHVSELWPRRRQKTYWEIALGAFNMETTPAVCFHVCLPIWKKSRRADRELKTFSYHTVFFTHFSDAASHDNSIGKHIWAEVHAHFLPHILTGATLWSLCDSTAVSFTCWPHLCRLLLISLSHTSCTC